MCGDSTGLRVRRARAPSLPAAGGKAALTEKLQVSPGRRRAVILGPFTKSLQRSGSLLSFFDDDEETAPRPSPRAPRQRPIEDRPTAAGTARTARTPQPRRAQGSGASGLDQHTLMVRRRVAVGIGIVALIVIVLLVNGCLKSQKTQSLKDLQPQRQPDRRRNRTRRSPSPCSRR